MSEAVLITGGNGFIGYHLISVALEKGFRVLTTVRSHSKTNHLDDLDIEVIRVDYLDPVSLRQSIEQSGTKIDLVVHCAGVTEARDENGFREGNVTITRNLLAALRDSGVLQGKFVYFSSLAARGPMEAFSSALNDSPISAYGRSKLAAEQEVINSGFQYLIVRPTAVYGPRDTAFLKLAKAIKMGVNLTLGNRDQKLTMIHGLDLSMMIFEAAQEDRTLIYGYDGQVHGQQDISEAVKSALNKKFTLSIWIPVWLFRFITIIMNGFYRTIFNRNWTYTLDKVGELTADDWSIREPPFGKTTYDLISGFKNTVQWYREEGWL